MNSCAHKQKSPLIIEQALLLFSICNLPFNFFFYACSNGPFKHTRDLNIQVLLKYDVDRLLAPYRKEAGLTPRDSSYINWMEKTLNVPQHCMFHSSALNQKAF